MYYSLVSQCDYSRDNPHDAVGLALSGGSRALVLSMTTRMADGQWEPKRSFFTKFRSILRLLERQGGVVLVGQREPVCQTGYFV